MLQDIADPDRRPGHLRGARAQARACRRSSSSAGPSASWSDKDTTTIIGGARRPRRRSTAAIAQIRARDRQDHQRLRPREAGGAPGEARRRRRGHPGRRAVGVRNEDRRRRRSTTRSAPPRRRSPRASCRAAAWRCCAASRRWRPRRRSAEGDERTGLQILERALSRPRPARSPRTRPSTAASWWPRCSEGKGNYGFDAAPQGNYVDLVEAGIIDPTKVVRVALENAVSVASMLLLTEATMTEIPEEKTEATARPEAFPG